MTSPRFAFFDVDETLIRTKSMFDFYKFFCEMRGNLAALRAFEAEFAELFRSGLSRETLNRVYYRHLAGETPFSLQEAGAQWWARTSMRPGILIEETAALLRDLAAEGFVPVFVSGSFEEVLEPLAAELGVTHILCAPMVVGPGGFYTGELNDVPTIGMGKRSAILRFLKRHGSDAQACWAIGDDTSDLPMLEAVGRKAVVGADGLLARCARDHGWRLLENGLSAA